MMALAVNIVSMILLSFLLRPVWSFEAAAPNFVYNLATAVTIPSPTPACDTITGLCYFYRFYGPGGPENDIPEYPQANLSFGQTFFQMTPLFKSRSHLNTGPVYIRLEEFLNSTSTNNITYTSFRVCPENSYEVGFSENEFYLQNIDSSSQLTPVFLDGVYVFEHLREPCDFCGFESPGIYAAVIAKCQRPTNASYYLERTEGFTRRTDNTPLSCVSPDGEACSSSMPTYYVFPTRYCVNPLAPLTNHYCRNIFNDYTEYYHRICPAGSRCDGQNRIPCTAGYYCPDTSGNEILCDEGYYCPSGSFQQTQCAPGTFCLPGATQQSICPANYYCPDGTAPIACAANRYCPPGSIEQGPACNVHGTRNVTSNGECSCYEFFTGNTCDVFTLFGINDTFTPSTIDKTPGSQGIFSKRGSSTINTVRAMPNATICGLPAWPIPFNGNRGFSGEIPACCYETTGTVSQFGSPVALARVACELDATRDTSEFEYQSDVFMGVSARVAGVGDFHYCCKRFTALPSSERSLFRFLDTTFKVEKLVHRFYLPSNDTLVELMSKHYYGAVTMFLAGRYHHAQMAFKYIFLVHKHLEKGGQPYYEDIEDIVRRSIAFIKANVAYTDDTSGSFLLVRRQLFDYNLPQAYAKNTLDNRDDGRRRRMLQQESENDNVTFVNGSEYNMMTVYAVRLARLVHLSVLQEYASDTFFQFLRPITDDLQQFVENAAQEDEVFDVCQITDVPISCIPKSGNGSDTARIERLAAIARCDLVPRSTNLTQYVSAILPPMTFLGRATICLRQIEPDEDNVEIYLSGVVYLSEMRATIERLFQNEQAWNAVSIQRLLELEYQRGLRIRNGRDDPVLTINDNTLNFYINKIDVLQQRLEDSRDLYTSTVRNDAILAAIDDQTAALELAIAQGNLDTFVFLNASFTTSNNLLYTDIDFEEESLNLSITAANQTLRGTLARIEADLDQFQEYIQVFDTRIDVIKNTSIERIGYLYDRARAEADLAYAKAKIDFIKNMILDVVSIGLAFAGPIGFGADLLLSGIGLATDQTRRQLLKKEPRIRFQRQLSSIDTTNELRLIMENEVGFDDYNSSSIEFFASFSNDALQIVSDTFHDFCNATGAGVRLSLPCMETFDGILFMMLEQSLFTDYNHGCLPDQSDALQPNTLYLKRGERSPSVESAMYRLYATRSAVNDFYTRMAEQIDLHWSCVDDFFEDEGRRRSLLTDGDLIQLNQQAVEKSLENIDPVFLSYLEDPEFSRLIEGVIPDVEQALPEILARAVDDVPNNAFFEDIIDDILTVIDDSPELPPPERATSFVDDLDELAQADVQLDDAKIVGELDDPDTISVKNSRAKALFKKADRTFKRIGRKTNNAMRFIRAGGATKVAIDTRATKVFFDKIELPEKVFDEVVTANKLFPKLPSAKQAGKLVGKALNKVGDFMKKNKKAFGVLGSALTFVSIGVNVAAYQDAQRQYEYDKQRALDEQSVRHQRLAAVMDVIFDLFGDIIVEFQKQMITTALATMGVACEDVLDDDECAILAPASANLWSALGFAIIDFLETGSGLCPLTADTDVLNLRRQLSMRSYNDMKTPARFLTAIDDKKNAEAAIQTAINEYNIATARMYSKECPEFKSIVNQMTSYGQNVQLSVIQAVEQVRTLNTLSKQRLAISKRRSGVTQSLDVLREFNQAFLQAKLDDIEDTFDEATLVSTMQSASFMVASTSHQVDLLLDVAEYNVVFEEACTLARFLKPRLDVGESEAARSLRSCTIGRVSDVTDIAFNELIQKTRDTKLLFLNLFEGDLFSDAYSTLEGLELDITGKIDFNASEWLTDNTFSFSLNPPPATAYTGYVPTGDEKATYSKPWIEGSDTIFLYDVQVVFKHPLTNAVIFNDGTSSMISDIYLGPAFTQIWDSSQQDFLFNLKDNAQSVASVSDGRIKVVSRYFRDGATSLFAQIDNLLDDENAGQNPLAPLPSPYTQYSVQVTGSTRTKLNSIAPLAPKVSLLMNMYQVSNSAIQSPDTFTSAPTFPPVITAAPTSGAPTQQPTRLPTATNTPTTQAPTTQMPTTRAPTGSTPTTAAPTTSTPTTSMPTTISPTTRAPTAITMAPTTNLPSSSPTTVTEPPTLLSFSEEELLGIILASLAGIAVLGLGSYALGCFSTALSPAIVDPNVDYF